EAGSQTQSCTNPFQFSQLRGVKIVAFSEERTGILHIRIEHRFEEIVAQIVMHPADFSGAPQCFLIRKKRGEQCPDIGKSKCKTLVTAGTSRAGTTRRPRVAVPSSRQSVP